jgi:UDP-N-acetylglucosamine 1-carboxyvinyltransferase
MEKLCIKGGVPLRGKIEISGAKNAALPILTTSLLTSDTMVLSNVPNLGDINTMSLLLNTLGVTIEQHKDGVYLLSSNNIHNRVADYDIVRKMRASIWVLAPLLARFGDAIVSLPGGCAIGTRPVDLHLYALERMGAEISLKDGYIHAKVNGKLKGCDIYFDKVSVGATISAMMAATLAEGQTTIINAAREPEIIDTARCLQAMGADICGVGTDNIVINGVSELHGANYQIMPDRIEAATYAVAALMTNGELELHNIVYEDIENVIIPLMQSGASIERLSENSILVKRGPSGKINPVDISTSPYPGFPTDMQAQFMALMTIADGPSIISETVFENRFMHVPELCRMGANISLNGHTAIVKNVPQLYAANVMATDLRASVSLVLAALAAEGESYIHRVYHLDRGYENIDLKLKQCGVMVERLKEKDLDIA